MELSVIELVLRHAVARGALDQADVESAVDRMWGAVAIFKEAEKTARNRESKMAEAIEAFTEASTDVVELLNSAAAGG